MPKEILLKSFPSNTLAEIAQNFLKSYGILSFLKAGGLGFKEYKGDSNEADLYVLEKDYQRAKDLLDD